MALFRIFKGSSTALGATSATNVANEGFAYFTPDDGKFYIDIATAATAVVGVNRIPLNAKSADEVQQNATTNNNANYRLLLSTSSTNDAEVGSLNKAANLQYNPSTDTLSTKNINLTGALDIVGNAYLHNSTTIDSLTVGSLIVNGNSSFINDVSFNKSPVAPTPSDGDSSTKLATTAFVKWENLANRPISRALISKGTTATTVIGEIYGISGVAIGSTSTIYSKWLANLDTRVTTPTDGMIIQIKIPIAGVNAGCSVSIDNGTNFYPVTYNTNGRVTTHFSVSDVITLQFDASKVIAAYGFKNGTSNGNATTNITGCWRLLNMYDTNTTYSAMSVAEMRGGTATSSRIMRADYLKTFLSTLGGTNLTLTHNSSGIVLNHDASGVTASTYGNTNQQTPTHGGTFNIPYFTVDAQGHITSASTATVKLPDDNDTKNTAGATDTSSKVYLIGATEQTANPQTYSDDQVYVENGTLYLIKSTDLSGIQDKNPALIVGGATTSTHMEFDANEIQAKGNGTTAAPLYLNYDGGLVTVGPGGISTGHISIGGGAIDTDAGKTIYSSSTLYLTATAQSSVIFSTNNINRSRVDPDGHLRPQVTNTYDLGTTAYYWRNLYVTNSILNGTGNSTHSKDTSAALVVKGGISAEKQVSACTLRIDGTSVDNSNTTPKGVSMQYDATLEVLNFVFS